MLTYASKNWTINRSDKREIESGEMRLLRPVAGYILLDQNRITDIRSELKLLNLTEITERQNEHWYEYILRMTTDGLPKVLLNYKPRGRRNIGSIFLKSETGQLLTPLNKKNLKGRFHL
jgi:hypothetical protein